MTDTDRLVGALRAKAEKARAEAASLRSRGYGHTYEHGQLITRAETFEEAAAMARHPATRAQGTVPMTVTKTTVVGPS